MLEVLPPGKKSGKKCGDLRKDKEKYGADHETQEERVNASVNDSHRDLRDILDDKNVGSEG
jgi:hypothetical protein